MFKSTSASICISQHLDWGNFRNAQGCCLKSTSDGLEKFERQEDFFLPHVQGRRRGHVRASSTQTSRGVNTITTSHVPQPRHYHTNYWRHTFVRVRCLLLAAAGNTSTTRAPSRQASLVLLTPPTHRPPPTTATTMSSIMTTRETNRLHRWAMWRMTVNEGIIACIRDNGTTRVIYPDSSSSDTNSLGSEVGMVPHFHEFPFITPEQMSLARKLNLRERYGSHHGLSDDAYFIFGLPRISVGKDVPEVTSTGTRSVYETFSELGETNNNTTRGMGGGGGVNAFLNATYSEVGPTPEEQSLASNNDVEVQRINGYREGPEWRRTIPPVPRLNLHSIQEELNNNRSFSSRQVTQRYPANRNHSSSGYPEVADRTTSQRYSLTSGPAYTTIAPDTSDRYPPVSNQYGGYAAVSPTPRRDEFIYPPFSGRQTSQESPTRMSYSPSSSSPQHNSSQPTSPRQSYQAFPVPTKKSYSPLPTDDRRSHSPLPASPRQSGFPSTGGGKEGVGSPGYGNKMRPTRLLSDGEAERMKRQAYYDWTTPTSERNLIDFSSQSARYSWAWSQLFVGWLLNVPAT